MLMLIDVGISFSYIDHMLNHVLNCLTLERGTFLRPAMQTR